MGVGAYLVMRVLKSRALRGSVTGVPHPDLPGEDVLEVIFSDDGRLFGLSEEQLASVLDECIRVAAASGGTVNVEKLKAFKVLLQAGRLELVAGQLDTALGPLPLSLGGLKIMGAPALMGSDLSEIVDLVRDRMAKLVDKIKIHRPSLILSLRIMLAFAVSAFDYRLAVVPVAAGLLAPLQLRWAIVGLCLEPFPSILAPCFSPVFWNRAGARHGPETGRQGRFWTILNLF